MPEVFQSYYEDNDGSFGVHVFEADDEQTARRFQAAEHQAADVQKLSCFQHTVWQAELEDADEA